MFQFAFRQIVYDISVNKYIALQQQVWLRPCTKLSCVAAAAAVMAAAAAAPSRGLPKWSEISLSFCRRVNTNCQQPTELLL